MGAHGNQDRGEDRGPDTPAERNGRSGPGHGGGEKAGGDDSEKT